MKRQSIICLVMVMTFSLAGYSVMAREENMVKNGNFEKDTDGDGMADYWQFSGDKGVTATWERDEGFAGKYSQKLVCTEFADLSPASHAMLAQVNTLSLEKGKWYKISFAAKQDGIPGRTAQLAISNMNPWRNCGLQESFRMSREWRQFEFVFQASETISEKIRLQIWHKSTGTFWLDSVRVELSQPVVRRFGEVVPSIGSVNLLPNSSFECGASGWGSIANLPGWGGNLNLLVGEVDANTAAQMGKSSFRISLDSESLPIYYFDYFPLYRATVKSPLLANQGWIEVEPGADYTLSAYMKSADNGLAGTLSIRQAFRRALQKEIQLTSEWKRYDFTFQPQTQQIFVALGATSKDGAGTVWIDCVQLEKSSEATPYQPRAALEVGLDICQLGNLFPYGVQPEMTTTLFNSSSVHRSVKLHIQTTDFDDNIIHDDVIPVDVPPGQSLEVPVIPDVRKKGFYRLHLRVEGGETAINRSLRFAIVEPYAEKDSLFGMNHAYPWPHLLDLSKQMGLCWFRDWSIKWHDVEPEKGKFDFTEADHQIDRVLERDLNVLPLLPFPASNWSSSAGPEVKAENRYPASRERIAYMPEDLEDFAAYVRATVEHYRDSLRVWEILNEPIYTSYALPRGKGYEVKDYVRLLQVAYRAVKDADPEALVIGGIAGGPILYTRELIDSGGLDWVDALNLHTYPGLTPPEAYEGPLSQLRERMRSAGADKPIWFTEGAYYADDDMPFEPYSAWLKPLDSETEAAEYQVKFNTILLAYGVEKIIYHSGTPGSINNESLSGIFFEWGGAPRKMLVAQAAMSNMLPPNIKSLGRLEAPESVNAYGFEADEQTVIVVWIKEDTEPREISLAGKPWRAVDFLGNELETDVITLTERPVYLVTGETGLSKLPW